MTSLPEPSGGSAAQPSEEQLLQQCLDRSEAEQLDELERLCTQHPQLAAGLRRRYAMLASHGLVSLPLAPGMRFGAYQLIEELGRGGMGVVYLAEHAALQRRVALKLLMPTLLDSPAAAERFRRETTALAKIDHPGVCAIYEAGEANGQPFLAMRYVPGRTLAQVVEAARAAGSVLPLPQVVDWIAQAAEAVACAHAAGVVHRDLKPQNLVLGDDGRIVVLDFGLACQLDGQAPTLTGKNDPIGTPAYMAPEMVRGGKVDAAVDVHALGAILFELLTLAPAFAGVQRDEIFHRITTEDAPRLRVLRRDAPRDVELVVAVCLDKEPRRRYASAAALAADLRRVLQRQAIVARPLPRLLRAWRWSQRNRVAATGLVSLALLAGIASVFWYVQARSDRAMRGQRLVLAATAAADDSDLAGLLAEAAYRLQPNAESLDFLRTQLLAVHEERRLRRPGATWTEFARVDAEHMLVGGTEPWCELWHIDGLEAERRLALPAAPRAFAIGPDGTIAVATGQEIRLFDAAGAPLAGQRSGLSGVLALCWLDRHHLLFTHGGGATCWDLDGGADHEVVLPGVANGAVVVAKVSTNGRTLVLGSVDCAFAASVANGVPGEPRLLPGFLGAGPVMRIEADGGGDHLLTATSSLLNHSDFAESVHRNEVRWWRRDGDGWQLVRTIDDYPGEVWCTAVSPAGERFACGTNAGQVHVYSGDDGHLLYVCDVERGNEVYAMAWSHRGLRLAAATTNRTTYVYDDGGSLCDLLRCFGMFGVMFTADDRQLWTLGMECMQRHRLDQPERLRGHGVPLYFAAPVEPDGVVTVGKDTRALAWRDGAVTGGLRDATFASGWWMHAAPLPDGSVLTVGTDSRVRRFDRTGQRVSEPSVVIGGWLSRVLPLPDGRMVVVSNADPGAVVLAADMRSFVPLQGVHSAWSGDVTPDGRWFAVVGQADREVQAWDLRAKPPRQLWSTHIDSAWYPRAIAITDDGSKVVVGTGDGRVDVWAVGGERLRSWSAHAGPIEDLDLSADGRIATASADRTAAVWTMAGERVAQLRGHRLGLWSARFFADGRVVTCGNDGTAIVWPISAPAVLELARRDLHPENRREELRGLRGLVGDLLDHRDK